MKRRGTSILLAVVLAAGTAAFCVGRTAALRQREPAPGGPAGMAPERVQAEQRFEQQARQWAEEVRAKQAVLASMLPDTRFTGGQILSQVDDIARSHAALARSVGGHVVHLCSALPQGQGQRVMQSCANSLRGSLQKRYRWRGGAQDQGDGVLGGRGGGWGRGEGGRGAGYGRQYRGGRRGDAPDLARRLQLTQEQSTWIQEQDPNFAEHCARLRDRLYEAHVDLVASLENAPPTEQELATKVEALIAARDALEKRVAQHIVLLRPQLSQEQRDRLAELCQSRAAGGDTPVATDPRGLDGTPVAFLAAPILADLMSSDGPVR